MKLGYTGFGLDVGKGGYSNATEGSSFMSFRNAHRLGKGVRDEAKQWILAVARNNNFAVTCSTPACCAHCSSCGQHLQPKPGSPDAPTSHFSFPLSPNLNLYGKEFNRKVTKHCICPP